MLPSEPFRLLLRFSCTLAAAMLLASCAGPRALPLHMPELKLPRRVHLIEHVQDHTAQDRILVAQRESETTLRWLMFDPLGLPVARQLLEDGKWRNDGFLPPNASARLLFSALIFAWTAESDLDRSYPAGSWSQVIEPGGTQIRLLRQNGRVRWTIIWQAGAPADTFSIHFADGARWQIAPLKGTP